MLPAVSSAGFGRIRRFKGGDVDVQRTKPIQAHVQPSGVRPAKLAAKLCIRHAFMHGVSAFRGSGTTGDHACEGCMLAFPAALRCSAPQCYRCYMDFTWWWLLNRAWPCLQGARSRSGLFCECPYKLQRCWRSGPHEASEYCRGGPRTLGATRSCERV